MHETVMGVVPDATLLRQPGMRFPAIRNVTFPATETDAVIVTDDPFDIGSGIDKVTVIAAPELLVINRVLIAAISLPASSLQRPPAAPPLGAYANVTEAPAGMALLRVIVATLPEKLVEIIERALPLSEIV